MSKFFTFIIEDKTGALFYTSMKERAKVISYGVPDDLCDSPCFIRYMHGIRPYDSTAYRYNPFTTVLKVIDGYQEVPKETMEMIKSKGFWESVAPFRDIRLSIAFHDNEHLTSEEEHDYILCSTVATHNNYHFHEILKDEFVKKYGHNIFDAIIKGLVAQDGYSFERVHTCIAVSMMGIELNHVAMPFARLYHNGLMYRDSLTQEHLWRRTADGIVVVPDPPSIVW